MVQINKKSKSLDIGYQLSVNMVAVANYGRGEIMASNMFRSWREKTSFAGREEKRLPEHGPNREREGKGHP